MKSFDPAIYVSKCREIIKHNTIQALSKLGEECVKYVRDRTPEESWKDHTGNLRSSVGYMVLYDGQPVQQGGFKPTTAPEGNGAQGRAEGEKFLKEVVTQISKENSFSLVPATRTRENSFSLVLVAGMYYADKVEALENKNVLAGAHLFAIEEWRYMEKALKDRIEKDINKIQIF